MGKNNKHKKQVKAEKAKVKLKTKKSKVLPKNQNVTDTNFKVKKIVLREQLKKHEHQEILSRRKLNVKDLLTRIQHHNSTVRQEGIKELKEILTLYPKEIISSHLNVLLQGIASLTLDKEKEIRQDGLKVLNFILETISDEQLDPFADILISYLSCSMTHINPIIKEDSLNYLDVLVGNCQKLIAINSRKILSYFLDMISRHHSQSQTNRHLSVTLNSKNTSIKWRTKVFERLSSIFKAIIDNYKIQKCNKYNENSQKIVYINDDIFNIPIYEENNLKICQINFEPPSDYQKSDDLNTEQDDFNKYIEILMPLILESWLEVRPKEKLSTDEIPLITGETANLLKFITMNIQLIFEFINLVEPVTDKISKNICDKFQNNTIKYLFTFFPYRQSISIDERHQKKRQSDYFSSTDGNMNNNNNCLEQNLSLCYIFMWMISVNPTRKFNDNIREISKKILRFVNDTICNWKYNDAFCEQLMILLKLIIKCTKILYKNNIDLGSTLHVVIVASSTQLNKEFSVKMFDILGDITLNNNLRELHCEPSFKEFIEKLPDLLLNKQIHDNTVKLINRVVLQYRNLVRSKLTLNQADILENIKNIEIIGSKDVKESKLMICNLFHFLDGEIYY